MPRLKPTTKLDVIGNFALNPEKAVHNLNESILQHKLFIKPPKWDSPGDRVELLAIQNEREHIGLLQLQEEMRDHALLQSVINTNRTDELEYQQSVIRRRFSEANNFFKDCDDKKKFAESKVSEEKQVHIELKQAIQDNKNNVNVLTEFGNALRKTVKEYGPYETVITEVVRQKSYWNTVKDCIDACDALMMTQVEICEMKKQKLEEIEAMRQNMLKSTNEAALTVLGLNNELAELERAYAYARSECLKWEKIMVNIKQCLAGNCLLKGMLMDEIQIIYRILCKRRGFNAIYKKEDIESQMDYIKVEIEILREVVNECSKIPYSKK